MAVIGLVQGRFGLTQKLYHIARHARFPNCTVQESFRPGGGQIRRRDVCITWNQPAVLQGLDGYGHGHGRGSAAGTTRPRTTAQGSRAAMSCCTPGTMLSLMPFSRYLWAATRVGSQYPAAPRCQPQASAKKGGGNHWPGVAGFGRMKECQCGAGRPSAAARSHWKQNSSATG